MLTITMTANYHTIKSKYNTVVAEEMAAKTTLDDVTEKVEDIEAAAGSKTKLQNNESYKKLVAFQDTYDTKVASLESQAKLLQTQIQSYESALSNNSNKNTFWCFG